MDNVYHHIDAKVAANSSLFRLSRISRADNRPDTVDGVFSR